MSTITVSPRASTDSGDGCTLLGTSSEMIRALTEFPANRKCFDCVDINSPRYICFPFSTFVCSCCANIHKEFGHPIKCLNVFVLTASDLSLVQRSNNQTAACKWLAKWTPDCMSEPDPTSPTYNEDARKYIKAKYIEKKWYADEPIFPTNAFLSPPLMCPYMPPAYTPFPPQRDLQYSRSVDRFPYSSQPVPIQPQSDGSLQTAVVDHNSPYYSRSSSPMDFNIPLFPRSLSPQVYSPPSIAVSTSPGQFLLSPQGPLSRSTTAVEGKTSSPTLPQALYRSVSDTSVTGSPKRPDLKVSPVHKNIDKSSIRHKFRVHTLVNKMANLLTPKKLNE